MPRWSTGRPCPTHTTRPAKEAPVLTPHPTRRRSRRLPTRSRPATAFAAAVLLLAVAAVALAAPAMAATPTAPSLGGVIDALRLWLVGILAGLATLFLTVGGIRYLAAGGDPAEVERAKVALKSAAIGYALAALAPLLVSILQSVVGG